LCVIIDKLIGEVPESGATPIMKIKIVLMRTLSAVPAKETSFTHAANHTKSSAISD